MKLARFANILQKLYLQQIRVEFSMMHEEELKDKCALCGRLLSKGSDDSTAGNPIIKEIIQNTDYKFDTREGATMFKRFLDVYGNQFQPFLG